MRHEARQVPSWLIFDVGQMKSFYILRKNRIEGPFERENIVDMLRAGEIHDEVMTQWTTEIPDRDLTYWKPLRCFIDATAVVRSHHASNTPPHTDGDSTIRMLEAALKRERALLAEERKRLAQERALFEEERRKFDSERRGAGSKRTSKRTAKDHARTLRLAGRVTKAEIKQSYRNLAKAFHPDALAGQHPFLIELAAEHFKEINEAYEYLCVEYGIR